MNSNVKTKVLAQALVITLLLALQSNADFKIMSYSDCGPTGWRLSNVEIENREDRWSIEADVVYGSNSSIVHTFNVTMPYCKNLMSCENRRPIFVVKDVSCGSLDIEPPANETCEMVKKIATEETLLEHVRDYYNISTSDLCIKYVETSLEVETYIDFSPIDDSSSSSESSEDSNP